MPEQKLNSSLLVDTIEVLNQTITAMSNKSSQYVLDNPVEFFKWRSAVEEGQDFLTTLMVRAEQLKNEEQNEHRV